MEQPNGGQPEEEHPNADPSVVLPSSTLRSDQEQETNPCDIQEDKCGITNDVEKKSYWGRLANAGPDRHIELLLAFFIAFFAASQWITSCSNNSSTSKQSERLLDSANRIDDAADSFSTSSADISRSMGDAVEQLQTQAGKMDKARESSEANSTKALQETIDNFHQDQRAWIGTKGVIDIEFSDLPNPISARLSMTNYGKTPAKNVIAINFLHATDNPIDPVEYMKNPTETGGENHGM